MSAIEAPREDERDPYWEYQEDECGNCGGEGFVYGCSWDWQCETWDEGEGTCLCTRPCDWCSPRKPDPELQRVLAEALARDSGSDAERGDANAAPSVGSQSGAGTAIAHPHHHPSSPSNPEQQS